MGAKSVVKFYEHHRSYDFVDRDRPYGREKGSKVNI